MFKRLARTLGLSSKPAPKLRLSVIVVCYQMDEQIGNTLRSLLPPYQQKIKKADFEILIMDNGSPQPLRDEIWQLASNIRYIHIPPGEASPNPGVAINRGLRLSGGEAVCVMIDGARMASPGVLSWGLRLLDLGPRGLVEVRGWHLGPKFQPDSIMEGYCHEVEKKMLLDSQWWENGYRLFEISAASAQTLGGFSGPSNESNCVFMPRALYEEIGGYDEAFKEAGGGLVNIEFYARAVAAAGQAFTVLGEGTFHQVHGGAATGLSRPDLLKALERWRAEARTLHGEMKGADREKFILAGHLPAECKRWVLPK